MEPLPVWAAILVLVFSGASFFFALAETALFSLGNTRARQLTEQDPRLGGIVQQLLASPQELLAAMVLGNTFATAALLAVVLWMTLTGHWPASLSSPGPARRPAHRLRGPAQNPGRARPERWSMRTARPLSALRKDLRDPSAVGPEDERGHHRPVRPANGQVPQHPDRRRLPGIARTGHPAGHAGRVREGNHPPDHQPRPAHRARRDEAARRGWPASRTTCPSRR